MGWGVAAAAAAVFLLGSYLVGRLLDDPAVHSLSFEWIPAHLHNPFMLALDWWALGWTAFAAGLLIWARPRRSPPSPVNVRGARFIAVILVSGCAMYAAIRGLGLADPAFIRYVR